MLVQLKTRINAYGLNSTEVLDDEHIWRQIRKLEIGLYQLSNHAVPGLEMALLLLGVAYRFAKIDVLKKQYFVLAVIAAYFATATQLMVDLSEMFEMGTYEVCINNAIAASGNEDDGM